ncbi:MAG: thiolase family protein [bacterium]|nr:thiolase family protein [bacterium]MDE0289878.1 thiolase family protein [bacterium]MDE0436828.1 thiolase family protein [bacterium]
MTEIYIADACRTPMGRIGGQLAAVRPDDLAAHVVGALLGRNPSLRPSNIEDVVWGAANQAGEDNRNVARMAGLLAGLGIEMTGQTVNRLCGSGLQAVVTAAQGLASGWGEVMIAGGSESMSRAPFVVTKPERAYGVGAPRLVDTVLGWRLTNPRMQTMYPPITLGETAEEVAAKYGVSRNDQDDFALTSHRRAIAAQSAGRFDSEIVPIKAPAGPKGRVTALITSDQGPRPDTSMEALGRLRPVFRKGGTVTAGNSSPMNDGAAGVILATSKGLEESGLTPMARLVSSAVAGVHPDLMGIGPVPSTQKALDRAGLAATDLDLVELNEAFAAQAVACRNELGLDPETVNVNGGAIALGHPLGCSGARILTTLAHELRRREARYGLATMCIGVGQGISLIVERV